MHDGTGRIKKSLLNYTINSIGMLFQNESFSKYVRFWWYKNILENMNKNFDFKNVKFWPIWTTFNVD